MNLRPLNVKRTLNFDEALSELSKKEKTSVLYNLERITKEDIIRFPNFRSDISHFKKYDFGDYRIFLVYCSECFHKFNSILGCTICDEDQLERIIAVYLQPRKKLYRHNKIDLSKIRF